MNVTLFFKDSSLFITGVGTPAYVVSPLRGSLKILHSSLLTLHFKDSSLFIEERACGHSGFLVQIIVVLHTGAALLGEHRLGALGILGEREVLVDTHHMGHALHIQVVGAYQREGPALLLQFVNQLAHHP